MFDQIYDLVREHLGNNPDVASHVPEDKKDAVYNEVATHLNSGLKNHEALGGGGSNIISMLQNAVSTGSPLTSAIEGGLVSSLASKFGLPPSVTGAIAGALPGLLQKFAHKAADPTDPSISAEKLANPAAIKTDLGGLFN